MAFISEIHYLNSYAGPSGVNEFVEVTLSPAEYARASDFAMTTYQTDGTVRTTFNLGDLTPVLDPDTGYYVYTMTTPVTDPDHTSGINEAEAVALTDSTLANPISFVDIGGATTGITATEGPADGATSTNIPPAALENTIQWDIAGNRIDDTIDSNSSIVCIANGSWIDTPHGPTLIEDLQAGDLVNTFDRGAQPIRMICARSLSAAELAQDARLLPICLRKDAIAPGQPCADLRVSPQHRMLITGSRMELLFGRESLLVKAKSIAEFGDRAFVDRKCRSVTYFHILFDRHEIIFANGAATESFYPGEQAIRSLDPAEKRELFTLFPAFENGTSNYPPEDHPTLRRWEAAVALTL